jgi:hypothetical protein
VSLFGDRCAGHGAFHLGEIRRMPNGKHNLDDKRVACRVHLVGSIPDILIHGTRDCIALFKPKTLAIGLDAVTSYSPAQMQKTKATPPHLRTVRL